MYNRAMRSYLISDDVAFQVNGYILPRDNGAYRYTCISRTLEDVRTHTHHVLCYVLIFFIIMTASIIFRPKGVVATRGLSVDCLLRCRQHSEFYQSRQLCLSSILKIINFFFLITLLFFFFFYICVYPFFCVTLWVVQSSAGF